MSALWQVMGRFTKRTYPMFALSMREASKVGVTAEKVVDKHCRGCAYLKLIYDDVRYCSYLLDTDKRRPCPAGKGCTVKTKKGAAEDGKKLHRFGDFF
jgi:hypothetical protein